MVGYTTLGTNDLERAVSFFETLLGEFEAREIMNDGRLVLWGTGSGGMFAICKPYDEQPASAGNGTMVALNMETREKVEQLYARAIELGGTDEGPPGERTGAFYGGYFRDLDGNKFCAFCIGA